ncbi:hypothetical protein MMC12_005239 [Toensbergia leucococca]|nr:hypothetical protein [Toensbergia leucococca]
MPSPSPPVPTTPPPRTSSPPNYPKRGLPPSLSSTYPHGLITGQPRTPTQQAAFSTRKAEILRTMSAEQMERAYWEVVGRIEGVLEEARRENEEVERDKVVLIKQREMERRIFWKALGRGEDGEGEGSGESGLPIREGSAEKTRV